MVETEISSELIQKAMKHPDLLKHLQVVADRVKSTATSLAAAEGVEMEVSTISGVRPGGRPYVNVLADNEEQEFGSSRTGRRRILGRAGESA